MKDCLFCRIIEKTIPGEIVYENEFMTAFRDIHPVAPVHILFIPKKHIDSVRQISGEDEIIIGKIFSGISEYARKEGLEKSGYRIINNTGEGAGQTVFHIHFHLLSGRQFQWPPG